MEMPPTPVRVTSAMMIVVQDTLCSETIRRNTTSGHMVIEVILTHPFKFDSPFWARKLGTYKLEHGRRDSVSCVSSELEPHFRHLGMMLFLAQPIPTSGTLLFKKNTEYFD